MHKSHNPSFLVRHRLFILCVLVWSAVWTGVVYLFNTYPYALDNFDFNSSAAGLATQGVFMILLALALITISSLVDGSVRDRRRRKSINRPAPALDDKWGRPPVR